MCYGSTNLLDTVPARPSSKWALEGTTAHEVVEAGLRAGARTASDAHLYCSEHCATELNTNQNQFYYSVQVMLNHVYDIMDEYPDAIMYVENEVDVPSVEAPGEADGLCDVMIYIPSIRTLHVIDFKHGAGIAKDAKGNPQILQYGAGCVWGDNTPINPGDVDTVVLTIVQPRAFHKDGIVREDYVTPDDLLAYLVHMDKAIAENMKPDAPLVPGDDQCRFCDANALCPGREQQALAVMGDTFKHIQQVVADNLPDARSFDAERLGFIRKAAPFIRKWLGDVDSYVEERLKLGENIPGAKLVPAQAKRQYHFSPAETAERASALSGLPIDQFYVTSLLPLTKLEPLVVNAFKANAKRGQKQKAAEQGKNMFAMLTTKTSSGNVVVADDDDPRQAVDATNNTFKQIAGVLPPPSSTS